MTDRAQEGDTPGEIDEDLIDFEPQAIEAYLEATDHAPTKGERRHAANAVFDHLLATETRGRRPADSVLTVLEQLERLGPAEARERIDAIVDERERDGTPLLTQTEKDLIAARLLGRLGAL